MGVLRHVGVLLGHHLHVDDAEVLTDFEDGLLVAAGRGAHPRDERVLGVGVVALCDVDVGVVAARAVALVEGEVRHVPKRDAVADEVVFDDLRRGDDDLGLLPEFGPVVGPNVAGEDDDFVVRDGQRLAVEIGVLLDQRLRRREKQRLSAHVVEALGGDEQADGRLPEAGGETDQRVAVARGPGEANLIEPPLDERRRE